MSTFRHNLQGYVYRVVTGEEIDIEKAVVKNFLSLPKAQAYGKYCKANGIPFRIYKQDVGTGMVEPVASQ